MHLSRRNVLTGLTSLFAAPAIVRANSLMKLHQIPERYATVWGVGHNLEVVEHVIWTPNDALMFARYNALDKFREVTEVVYTNQLPWPLASSNHWVERVHPAKAFFDLERSKLAGSIYEPIPTVGFHELKETNMKQMNAMFKGTEHLSIRSVREKTSLWG